MNRRSLSCDAELDCAVMHRPALQTHLANLHLTMTGQGWTDFGHGWLLRFWQSIQANHAETLVNDPFWQDDGGRRYTPNHVEITWDGLIPEYEFEPSSIGPVSWKGIPDIETNVCARPAHQFGGTSRRGDVPHRTLP